MTVLATVVEVGVATVQDSGRGGYQRIGVPVAGAWHRLRYESACRLLHDTVDAGMPAVELLAGSLQLRFSADAAVAAVGSATLTIDNRPVATGTVVHVHPGELLALEAEGPTYLTVSGWSEAHTLGSCSTDTFSGLGGRVLAVGDELRGEPVEDLADRVGTFQRSVPDALGPIRVVAFRQSMASDFFTRRWIVQRRSRSGIRLRSAGWAGPAGSVDSMPVLPGTVQVTPDGEAIVLGPDGGLTGGYPVVGVVASADLDRLSLVRDDESLAFALTDAPTARAAWATRQRRLLKSFANPRDIA